MPFNQISATLFLIIAAVILTCCSSSDSSTTATAPVYSGNTSPATITESNATDIGVAATEAANEAVSANKGNDANPFSLGIIITEGSSTVSQQVVSITRTLIDDRIFTGTPAGITLGANDLGDYFQGYCGGTITAPDGAFSGDALNGSITFGNFCINTGVGNPITINGTAVFTQTTTEITLTYVNFAVTVNGETQRFNATLTCDVDFNCNYSSTFVGSDGSVHSIENYIVTGSDETGYSVSATFFHSSYGEAAFTTTDELTFGACGAFPDGGELSISGSDNSGMTVTFNSNCTYTIIGSDGIAAFGPFNGDWP